MVVRKVLNRAVLVPYEFTLLSNRYSAFLSRAVVLVPYEFTLLSNPIKLIVIRVCVLVPYEFTLLSNGAYWQANGLSFSTL